MAVNDYINRFVDYIKSQRGYSINTVRNYETDLRHFFNYVKKNDNAGTVNLEQIDFHVIRAYLGGLFKKYKKTTISRKLSAIRTFFFFLEKNNLHEGNPAAEISSPKQGNYIPEYLNVDDMFMLLDAPDPATPATRSSPSAVHRRSIASRSTTLLMVDFP